MRKYLNYSDELLKQSYSNMDDTSQVWNKHTKNEINFLLGKYIYKDNCVVDIGCGSGRHTNLLNNMGIETIGIDFSEKHIDIAKNDGNSNNFICCDVRYEVFPRNLMLDFVYMK